MVGGVWPSVTKGWVGVKFKVKKRCVTLEWPLIPCGGKRYCVAMTMFICIFTFMQQQRHARDEKGQKVDICLFMKCDLTLAHFC